MGMTTFQKVKNRILKNVLLLLSDTGDVTQVLIHLQVTNPDSIPDC